MTAEAFPDPASFRDPGGRVLHLEGRVFRALTSRGAKDWQAAKAAAAQLIEKRLLVGTRELADADVPAALRQAAPGAETFLEHDRIGFISQPAEWTVAMLADAALLTLDVQLALLPHKLSLQDATAYNIAFHEGRPVLIDAGSIVRPARLDVWYALGQFQRMFLYPLMLSHRGFTPGDVFVSSLDGVTPSRMARALGRWGWLRPSLLTSVYLPAWLEGGKAGGAGGAAQGEPTGNPEVQATILRANARRVRRLREKFKPRGVWVDYRKEHSYSEMDEQAKQQIVGAFAARFAGKRVIDLGANTGTYSRICTQQGCHVLAVDLDHDALDTLYREAAAEGVKQLDFARTNLANPTPAIGYMNVERPSFLQRARGDAAIALALCHHLLVGAGLTLPQVAKLLAGFAPNLLVEWVDPADPMFQKLTAGRENLWAGLARNDFVTAMEAAGLKHHATHETGKQTRALTEFTADG